NLSLHQSGKASCDDDASKAEFTFVEAEVQVTGDIHAAGGQILNDAILKRGPSPICVYGPWVYDKGHCWHSGVPPAEQVWFRDDLPNGGKKYSLNVISDGSKRFWWRDQMDDGTKLKPWGAPPIKGLFAIAFEVKIGGLVATPPVLFEVANVDFHN